MGTLRPVLSREIAPQKIGTCVMSTAAFAPAAAGTVLASWETQGVVTWGSFDPTAGALPVARAVAKGQSGQKFPALAANGSGEVLVAWATGTGWNKGGGVAWQVSDSAGNTLAGRTGKAGGLPAWDGPAAFATPDGNFVIVY